jgi:hypothetical protein
VGSAHPTYLKRGERPRRQLSSRHQPGPVFPAHSLAPLHHRGKDIFDSGPPRIILQRKQVLLRVVIDAPDPRQHLYGGAHGVRTAQSHEVPPLDHAFHLKF